MATLMLRRKPLSVIGDSGSTWSKSAAVAGLEAELGVRAHEMRGHRHERAVRQTKVAPVAELLDARKNIIPAAAVETRGMRAQLVQDLVHLERGKNGLDQDRRLDSAAI